MHTSFGSLCYVKVCGGCQENNRQSFGKIRIVENLSDHNVYVGFKRNLDVFDSNKFRNAVYVYLHDTCIISDHFGECIQKLDKFVFFHNHWVFAQTFGLFNIWICTFDFILHRASDFEGISFIPKDEKYPVGRR